MGILAGLISVTGCGDNVEPWAAVCIGAVGGFVFTGMCHLLHYCGIDDPLDAAPMHFGCGVWGTLATGLFDRVILYQIKKKTTLFNIF
jgi:Amt family ammonium transporter